MKPIKRGRSLVSEGNTPDYHVRVTAKANCKNCHGRGYGGMIRGQPVNCVCLRWEREPLAKGNHEHQIESPDPGGGS